MAPNAFCSNTHRRHPSHPANVEECRSITRLSCAAIRKWPEIVGTATQSKTYHDRVRRNRQDRRWSDFRADSHRISQRRFECLQTRSPEFRHYFSLHQFLRSVVYAVDDAIGRATRLHPARRNRRDHQDGRLLGSRSGGLVGRWGRSRGRIDAPPEPCRSPTITSGPPALIGCIDSDAAPPFTGPGAGPRPVSWASAIGADMSTARPNTIRRFMTWRPFPSCPRPRRRTSPRSAVRPPEVCPPGREGSMLDPPIRASAGLRGRRGHPKTPRRTAGRPYVGVGIPNRQGRRPAGSVNA